MGREGEDGGLLLREDASLVLEPHQPSLVGNVSPACSTPVFPFFSTLPLHFHFAPNQFFTNSILTKCYEMKCEPPEDDPFSFEGPEIFKCTGCPIDWQKGKNLTVKQVKKKQKHKSKGSVRTITKQVKADSFFNFFDPPAVPDDPNAEVDEDTQALLTADFEIGHYIRERIVPRAVLFFTGEALEDESDYEEEEEEEGDDDDDGSGSENDADFDPKKAQANPECKQQ